MSRTLLCQDPFFAFSPNGIRTQPRETPAEAARKKEEAERQRQRDWLSVGNEALWMDFGWSMSPSPPFPVMTFRAEALPTQGGCDIIEKENLAHTGE
jgi:hypothetical protein